MFPCLRHPDLDLIIVGSGIRSRVGVAALRIRYVRFQWLESLQQIRRPIYRINPSGNHTPGDCVEGILGRSEAGGSIGRVGSGNIFLPSGQTISVLVGDGIRVVIGEPVNRQPFVWHGRCGVGRHLRREGRGQYT